MSCLTLKNFTTQAKTTNIEQVFNERNKERNSRERFTWTEETENRRNSVRVIRSFYGRGLPIQKITHPFPSITWHQKRYICTIQYLLFTFILKLLVLFFVLFSLLCFTFSFNKWLYTMIYRVQCKQVHKLFFWCMERINLLNYL